MIPNEAVEAAANAISQSSGMRFDGFWSRVEDLEPEDREYALAEARAALEAAAPHMQASVSTLAELDALPRFTVIRSGEGAVYERETMWHEAGSRDLKYSPDVALPATVLQLGWGEE